MDSSHPRAPSKAYSEPGALESSIRSSGQSYQFRPPELARKNVTCSRPTGQERSNFGKPEDQYPPPEPEDGEFEKARYQYERCPLSRSCTKDEPVNECVRLLFGYFVSPSSLLIFSSSELRIAVKTCELRLRLEWSGANGPLARTVSSKYSIAKYRVFG